MTGWSLYKPYSRPSIAVAIDSLYRDVETLDTASVASVSWDKLFTDPCLQALVAKGLVKNTDLCIARTRVEAAEAILMNARLTYFPSVSFTPEGDVSYVEGRTLVKSYNLAASANWELDLFGKITNAKRGVRAALESSRAYEQAVRTKLIATIAGSYYLLLMLDRQLDISQRTLDNWEEMERVFEALKRAGKADEAAVLQVRANRMALQASTVSILKDIRETENSLSALLAMPSDIIERGTLEEQHFPDTFSVGIPLQLLSNRPDVRQAEWNLAQAYYIANEARSDFYPSFTLSGKAGWTNNDGGLIRNPGSWLLNAIGTWAQTLFNKGIKVSNLRQAEARQEEALLIFQQSLLDAGKEVNDALARWQAASLCLEYDRQQIGYLQEAVRKIELLMQHSAKNYLEVLTVRQNLYEAELLQVQNRFEKIQGVISLYYALGGG